MSNSGSSLVSSSRAVTPGESPAAIVFVAALFSAVMLAAALVVAAPLGPPPAAAQGAAEVEGATDDATDGASDDEAGLPIEGLDLGSLNRSAQDAAALLPPDAYGQLESDLWGGPPPVANPDARYSRYVALGDSYASLGNITSPTYGPVECGRTTTNYPNFVARSELIGEFVDASCGGAEVPDMYAEQHPGVAPQLDALTPDTDLITLSIGGNDMGFGTILSCAFSNLMPAAHAPCRDSVGAEIEENMAALHGELDGLYTSIAERAPQARVVTTGYMRLLPETGGCLFTDVLGPGDVEWMNHVTEQINDTVRAAAERAGHDFALPVDTVDRSGCAHPEEAWTSHPGVTSLATPMHPTALGQAAMGGAVLQQL